jgi:hypothetical protein
MPGGFLDREIRRCNRNLLVFAFASIGTGAVLLALFLPFALDALRDPDSSENAKWGWTALAGIGATALLAGAITVLCRVLFFRAASHPVRQALVPFGNPDEVSTEIDKEMISLTAKPTRVIITPTWLLIRTFAGLKAARWDEVVWMYKLLHMNQGAKFHFIRIHTRRGQEIDIPSGFTLYARGHEDKVDDLLGHLSAQMPNTRVGYEDELYTLWQKDKDAFLKEVQSR